MRCGRYVLGFICLWFGGLPLRASSDFKLEALAPRSRPGGSTMFTLMRPEDTGVVTENRYADPRIWAERYHEFSIGAIGTGVAVGDYDGDGRPDLFVVSKTETCRLFRNLGNWKFEDVTGKAGLLQAGVEAKEWKQGAAFVDVNNDGRLDLYVCRHDAPNLLYINQGDGTFREEAAARGLALKDACGMAAFCDYDRDGWLDVFVQTNILSMAAHPSGQRDHLFHNKGDGTFTEVTEQAGIRGESQGHSATWWDYDGDGWPDLYVANDFMVPDVLYHNNRDGTFTNTIDSVMPIMPYHSMGADVGDFDGDGRVDLFVADMARTSVTRDRATIADSRARSRVQTPEGAAPQVMRNALYLATGTGRCREAAWMTGLAATDWTWSVRAEDLDNDGRVDLHVTNGMVRDYDSVDVRTRTMAVESPAERVRLMYQSPVAAGRHLAYRNLGDLQFEEVGAAWGLDQRGVSFGAAFADFDADGDLDLVYANYQAGVTLLRNDSQTGHRLIVALQGKRSNRFGLGAIVRIETTSGVQIRQLVSARGYLSTSEPIAHFGLGDDTNVNRLTVEWPSGIVQTITDVPADQRVTVTEAGESTPETNARLPSKPWYEEVSASSNLTWIAREASRDETEEQPLVSRRFDRNGPALAVADLDGDGNPDVVMGGGTASVAQWARGDGRGHWGTPEALPLQRSATLDDGPIAIVDVDGNGSPDLVVTHAGAEAIAGSPDYQPQLLLNNGKGNFRVAPDGPLPSLPMSVGALAVADFDHDGRPDIFFGGKGEPGQYPLSPRSALGLNRGGRFEDATVAWASGLERVGMVAAALAVDVDGDGWTDLLLAIEWGGVRYWHNEQGHGFAERSIEAGFSTGGSGMWTALATADFNGDGKPDFVAGNIGLNTPQREGPARLFYGDFGQRAGPLAIETRDDGGRIVPAATRQQLGVHWPFLAKRFSRNDAFAQTSLADIVGEENVKAAQSWTATELRSGIFLSQPDGTYRFSPLPRIAQIAPLTAMIAGDFDHDGCIDLFAVQNSHAPLARVGRYSGGLGQLLLGDGKGGFRPVAPAQSGLIVPGAATAVVSVTFGSGLDGFIVSRNNAPALVFRAVRPDQRAISQ